MVSRSKKVTRKDHMSLRQQQMRIHSFKLHNGVLELCRRCKISTLVLPDLAKLNALSIRKALIHFGGPDKQTHHWFATLHKQKAAKWKVEETLAGKQHGGVRGEVQLNCLLVEESTPTEVARWWPIQVARKHQNPQPRKICLMKRTTTTLSQTVKKMLSKNKVNLAVETKKLHKRWRSNLPSVPPERNCWRIKRLTC